MDPRPRLTRPVHPLARPDGSIQLGLDPRTALVASGVSAHECRWLATLDGSRTRAVVVTDAAAHGITRERAEQLVAAFVAQGVLTESDVEPSLDGVVAVIGPGAVPAHLAEVLRESGVSQVLRHVDVDVDVDGDMDDAVDHDGRRTGRVDLAIITSTVPVPAGAGERWRRAGIPHLPVWCGDDHASVGPVVVPGSGPCLQCLELTRIALDPAWSWIRAQISGPRVGALVPVESRATTRSLLVGITASLAVSVLTEGPSATGWSFDASSPGPTFERRRWQRHPACPRCGEAEVEQKHVRDRGPFSGKAQVDPQQWAG